LNSLWWQNLRSCLLKDRFLWVTFIRVRS
jgi:hypothetical protein